MRKCSSCGAEIPDGYDECQFCGTPASKYSYDDYVNMADMYLGDDIYDDDEYWSN